MKRLYSVQKLQFLEIITLENSHVVTRDETHEIESSLRTLLDIRRYMCQLNHRYERREKIQLELSLKNLKGDKNKC